MNEEWPGCLLGWLPKRDEAVGEHGEKWLGCR